VPRDGFYQKWAIPLGTSTGKNEKEQYFVSRQEGRRKDAERIYAYPCQKWNVLEQPARFRRVKTRVQVGTCCAVLHDMATSHRCKEPAVSQSGMCSAALFIFMFHLCPLFLFFVFLLVLTCYLLLKTGSGRLSLSLYAHGGAPSRFRLMDC